MTYCPIIIKVNFSINVRHVFSGLIRLLTQFQGCSWCAIRKTQWKSFFFFLLLKRAKESLFNLSRVQQQLSSWYLLVWYGMVQFCLVIFNIVFFFLDLLCCTIWKCVFTYLHLLIFSLNSHQMNRMSRHDCFSSVWMIHKKAPLHIPLQMSKILFLSLKNRPSGTSGTWFIISKIKLLCCNPFFFVCSSKMLDFILCPYLMEIKCLFIFFSQENSTWLCGMVMLQLTVYYEWLIRLARWYAHFNICICIEAVFFSVVF